jgi:thioredoxin reductase (NADPH)
VSERADSRHDGFTDLIIVGGGPVGLFGAFYAGMRGMRTSIIDCQPQLGGQLTALYPDKYVYDVAGFPKILARDLAAGLIEQAMRFAPTVRLEERVDELHLLAGGGIELRTSVAVRRARAVLLALGAGAFLPRKLDLPNAAQLEERGLYYTVRNREAFRGQEILVVGGGDSALDWALSLEGIARRVTLIHRRDTFRAHESSVEQLFASSIDVRVFHELLAIHGEERVEGATIFENRSKARTTLAVQAVLVNIGLLTNLDPVRRWGLALEGNGIRVDHAMATSLDATFAAGDIAFRPGGMKLIATGAGDAAVAINQAKHRLDPTAKVFPGHSSAMKIFK